MWGLKKLKEFAPKVDQRSAVGVGAGGNSGWDVLGAGPKANLSLPVDEKRWIFNSYRKSARLQQDFGNVGSKSSPPGLLGKMAPDGSTSNPRSGS